MTRAIRQKSPRWEGLASISVFLTLKLLALSTANPVLVMLANVAFFVCIVAAIAWIILAVVRRIRRWSPPSSSGTIDPRGPKVYRLDGYGR